MNASQLDRYGDHIWWRSFGLGPKKDIGPFTWESGCNHCGWKSGQLRHGNALKKAAKVKGKAMQHVRDAHPELLGA